MRRILIAGALGVAVAGAATTSSVIASADDQAPVAKAAQGGVTMTPSRVERTARRGTVGSFTVRNSTRDTLRVTVTVRPWVQDRASARVAINRNATLSPYVRASPQTLNIARGSSRRVSLRMIRSTAGGSLYGGIHIHAKQVRPKPRNGIIPQFDVIGSLRLNPRSKRPDLRVGNTDVVGRGNGRSLILAVRNIGNTIDPVAGTVRITGPSPRNANITPANVVPGQVVYLKGGSLSGMRAGNYRASWTVTHGGRRFTKTATFRL